MLNIQKFLIDHNGNLTLLKQYYGINAIKHPSDSRVILNYDQIDSSKHKFEPIVRECRGLVLDSNDWSLVTRGFYRFFNWGEYPQEMKKFDFNGCKATHKEDGSYVVVYHWNNDWHINTRDSFGTGNVNDFITWRELFKLASPNDLLDKLDPNCQYVFELCSQYNQIVRIYNTPSLFLLTVFNGDVELIHDVVENIGYDINVNIPKTVHINDIMDAEAYIANLARNDKTFEGLVLRDNNNIRFKHKSSDYIALHRRANNGKIASYSNLIRFVVAGERDELVTYFPYVAEAYDKLASIYNRHLEDMERLWFCYWDEANRRKFAEAISGSAFSWALFQCHSKHWKNGDPIEDCNPVDIVRSNIDKVWNSIKDKL